MVKKEQNPGCVANKAKKVPIKKDAGADPAPEKQSKETLSEFSWKMKSVPQHIRDYYENKLKFQKASKSAEKSEFISKVCDGDFEAEFFKRCEKVVKAQSSSSSETWMSYQQAKNLHGELVLDAMVRCNKMEVRDHMFLDKLHESYESIPEKERYQYKEVVMSDTTTNSHIQSVDRSSDKLPEEEQDHVEIESKQMLVKIKQAKNKWASDAIDAKIKLGRFESNRIFFDGSSLAHVGLDPHRFL